MVVNEDDDLDDEDEDEEVIIGYKCAAHAPFYTC